jgi:hypothetical protein
LGGSTLTVDWRRERLNAVSITDFMSQPKVDRYVDPSRLVASAFALASPEAAHTAGLRPIDAKSIDLGELFGVACYVERDGFHVVTTLAQGMAGTPIRVVSVLAPGLECGVLNTAPGSCARNQPERRRRAKSFSNKIPGQLAPSH